MHAHAAGPLAAFAPSTQILYGSLPSAETVALNPTLNPNRLISGSLLNSVLHVAAKVEATPD